MIANSPRILMSIPSRHHVEIAKDELTGLEELGYVCRGFPYAAKENIKSAIGRLLVIIYNALVLARIAKNFKPDVIYFNSRLEALAGIRDYITIIIVKALLYKRVRFVIKSHGSDTTVLQSTNYFISKVVLPYLKKNISAWLFLSNEEKEQIIGLNYFKSESIYVTKNIVRTTQFMRDDSFKKAHNIPNENITLLFVGRLIKEKGIVDVVEAFEKLNKENLTLIIVGDGEELNNVRQQIDKGKFAHQVILTGFIPEKEVVQYYSNCNILVFPTYFPEGFPMALFNAVGAGMPVITTRIRAAKDLLSEPENCLWVNAKDSANVVTAIERLLTTPGLMEQMSHNNKRISHIFEKKKVTTDLAAILDKVMYL
jgi:glycosyltransferase involved in cell wall biosynthesis